MGYYVSFCLPGIRAEVELRLGTDSDGGRHLLLIFSRPGNHPWVAQRRERTLVVQEGGVQRRLTYPQTWRRAIREQLVLAPPPGSPDAPFLARHRELYVGGGEEPIELTLQLFLIFCQWRWGEPAEDDRRALVEYLCRLGWRKPGEFTAAAEEVVGRLLTNWVMPQQALDFRRYARQTMWALYAQGARAPAIEERRQSRRRQRTEDWAEVQAEKAKRGKKRRSTGVSFSSVGELSARSMVNRRRIYEAIKDKKLAATKVGRRLQFKEDDAQEFCRNALVKRGIRALGHQLQELGLGRDAMRQRIYRLRRDGVSNQEILRRLAAEVKRIQQNED